MVVFPDGIKGLADTLWSGVRGSAYRLVGIDYRSQPGAIKVHQKLSKVSAAVVDELCKLALSVSDGSKIWFSSESGKIWREVSDTFTLIGTLILPDFDVRYITKNTNTYDYSAEVNIATASYMKEDGTKYYVMCNATISGNSGEIFEYDLSTPYDISTAVYDSKTFVADINSNGMFISPDGTRLFVSEDNGSTTVISYTMSTAWDISTAVADAKTFDFSGKDNRGFSLFFDPTGVEMFIVGGTNSKIYRYTLTTAWDVTTAGFVQEAAVTTPLSGMFVSTDGTRFFIASSGTDLIKEYTSTSSWTLTGFVDTGNSFDPVDSGITFGMGGVASPNGGYLYIGTQNSPETVHQFAFAKGDSNPIILGAEEFSIADGADGADEDLLDNEVINYIYIATENVMSRIAVSNIATDWNTNIENVGPFVNGDDTYHPIKKQNNRLYIGDKYVVASVDENGTFIQQTELNVAEPERINGLEPFDTDLLVTTILVNGNSRILRWDTESDSWYGQDDVYEKEIRAFIRDDNYVYALSGDFGQLYFYDGERLLPATRIPGDYSPTKRCKINPNAVGFLMGIPVFGVSNIEGDPVLQGLYTYGRYSKDYSISMDLSYPISEGSFAGVEIGAIIVDGANMYTSWKAGSTSGVDKLDWAAKYASAYIETAVLNNPEDRSKFKSLDSVVADYIDMPAGTSIDMQYNKNYAGLLAYESLVDAKLLQIRGKKTVKEMGSISLRFDFNVNANTAPSIENFHANFEGET